MRRIAFLSSRKSWKTLFRSRDNPYGLEALWRQGDIVARGTLILLLIMSAVSWYIIFTKLWDQRRLKQGRQGGREAVLELGLP